MKTTFTDLNSQRADATPEERANVVIQDGHKGELMTVPDQTFALRDGHYCIVSGRIYGPWADKGAATAGLQVEQRRVKTRQLKDPT